MRKLYLPACFIATLLLFAACKKTIKDYDSPNLINNPAKAQTTPWPEWIFHPWIWEGEGTSTSARQIVNDYLNHGIPVGAIMIDSPWETDYNTFDPDSTLYPDMKAMIDEFHAKNIKVLFWITGIIDTGVHPLFDTAVARHYFLQSSASSGPTVYGWWKGDGCLIDLYNPDAVAWWKGLMDKALTLGIDGWKCDGTDFYSSPNSYSPYLGSTIPSRNDYSNRYYQLFHDYTRQKLGIDRAITCRPIDNYGYGFSGSAVAFAPKEIGWSCWVGDQDATYNGMTKALNNMYFSDQYGYLGFGSDIGGYRTDNNYPATGRAKDLFIRWAQLGTFSGLMENGGGGEHRPWMFDDETNTIYKKFALLRGQMVPYLMSTATQRFKAGRSMMNFFNANDYSYTLGDSIFVAPVLSSDGTVTVNFPTGSNWVYLFNKSQVYNSGDSRDITFPIGEFPVYVMQGSTLVNTLNP